MLKLLLFCNNFERDQRYNDSVEGNSNAKNATETTNNQQQQQQNSFRQNQLLPRNTLARSDNNIFAATSLKRDNKRGLEIKELNDKNRSVSNCFNDLTVESHQKETTSSDSLQQSFFTSCVDCLNNERSLQNKNLFNRVSYLQCLW